MRDVILCVVLLNLASGYVWDNRAKYVTNDFGDSGKYGGGVFGGGGSSGGWGGFGGWNGGVLSRDAPPVDVLDQSYVPIEIKLFVGHALLGLTAEEMMQHCNRIKTGAQAQYDAGEEKISDEQSNTMLREMASKYPSILPEDLLNSDIWIDEAFKVSSALKILMDCAEEIQKLQGKGAIYFKVVIHLCDIIKSSSARVVDIYRLNMHNRIVNKRNQMRRDEWDTHGSHEASKGQWDTHGSATYDSQGGWSAKGSVDYTKDNLSVGGHAEYNQQSGASGGVGLTYKFR